MRDALVTAALIVRRLLLRGNAVMFGERLSDLKPSAEDQPLGDERGDVSRTDLS